MRQDQTLPSWRNLKLFLATIISAIVFWGAVWMFLIRSARRWTGESEALESLRTE